MRVGTGKNEESAQRSLLQPVWGDRFIVLPRRFRMDQRDWCRLLSTHFCLKHRDQFSKSRIRNGRDLIILCDARLEMSRLQTEICEVGGGNLG